MKADGKWASKEVGVNVPRQNGKGGILEVIELTAIFTWREHVRHPFRARVHHLARSTSTGCGRSSRTPLNF